MTSRPRNHVPFVCDFAVLVTLAWVTGCGESGGGGSEVEVITTLTLTFAPEDDGPLVTASFRDPDGGGIMSGVTDPILLAVNSAYVLTVAFSSELGETEDITEEIAEECEEHQVFVFGTAVSGPASDNPGALVVHAYADLESALGGNEIGEDLPVGLTNSILTNESGSGVFTVMLRHLPELNGVPQKVPDLAMAFARGESLAGAPDANVGFDLTVQ